LTKVGEAIKEGRHDVFLPFGVDPAEVENSRLSGPGEAEWVDAVEVKIAVGSRVVFEVGILDDPIVACFSIGFDFQRRVLAMGVDDYHRLLVLEQFFRQHPGGVRLPASCPSEDTYLLLHELLN